MQSGILIIGGYDPTGSAGVLQDSVIIRRFHIPVFVIACAFVYENTCRVANVMPLDLNKQFELAMEENLQFKGVKIGLVYNKEQLELIGNFLLQIKPGFIVFDPVRVSSSRFLMSLLTPADILFFGREFSPVLTPNREEYIDLFGNVPPEKIVKEYNLSLVIKGMKKAGNKVTDVIVTYKGEKAELQHEDLSTSDIHGTGCTLSSLLSVFLFRGHTLVESYKLALSEFKNALKNTLKAGCQRIFI